MRQHISFSRSFRDRVRDGEAILELEIENTFIKELLVVLYFTVSNELI